MNNNKNSRSEVFSSPMKAKKTATILELRQPTELVESESIKRAINKRSGGTFSRYSMIFEKSINSIEFNKITQNQQYTTFMQDLK